MKRRIVGSLSLVFAATSVAHAQAPEAPAAEPAATPAETQPEAPRKEEDKAKSESTAAAPVEATPAATAPSPASAAPVEDDLPAWAPASAPSQAGVAPAAPAPSWDATTSSTQTVTYPWVEHHGYMRLRLQMFHNFDLDTFYAKYDNAYSSPYLPPLTETNVGGSGHVVEEDPANPHTYKRGADTLSMANMRARWQPTVHIAETMRIKATIDGLDNLVLGSTPDGGLWGQTYERPDVALPTFSGGQRPPESGVNGWQDSVRVKNLWGEWRTPLGLLVFGRTPSNWGMGILSNNGECLDCNFGDSVDRVMGVTKLFGTYLALGWDFVNEGPTGYPGAQDALNQPFGQAYDLDQRDDVNEYVIALFRRPVTKEEKDARDRDLNEVRKPAFDWGVYNVIRTQEFVTDVARQFAPYTDARPEEGSNTVLRDIKAFAYIPDLWLKFEYRPQRNHFYRLQFESAFVLGVIKELPQRFDKPARDCLDTSVVDIEDCAASDVIKPRQRDIQQYGYALEFDHRMEKLQWGFHQGLASGDTTDGFGVIDRTPIDPNDNADQKITNFKFDRDYTIDLIMFRQLIGAITNAVYFKPYIQYDIVQTDRDAIGFKLASIYAFALESNATPGDESPLGLEFDASFYITELDRFRWSLDYGLMVPFGAFNVKSFDQNVGEYVLRGEPGVAQTLQMFVGMQF